MAKGNRKNAVPPGGRSALALSEEDRIFIHAFIKYGGVAKAAEEMKIGAPKLKTLMARPVVQQYLRNYNHHFLREMARWEVHQITKHKVTREDIVARLLVLGLMEPEDTKGTIEGQVEALAQIAEILGMKFSPRDADRYFDGKTPEQLRNYAKYGKFELTPEEKEKEQQDAPAATPVPDIEPAA